MIRFFLTIVLSILCGPVLAMEPVVVTYGGAILNLPVPKNLCLDDKSDIAFNWQASAQREVGNKLLNAWIDCDSQDNIRAGDFDGTLDKWVLVYATSANGPGTEALLTGYSQEQFRKLAVKLLGIDNMGAIYDVDDVNEILAKANEEYFGDKDKIIINEQTYFGLLKITDSLHVGMLQQLSSEKISMKVVAVLGVGLVKGVVLNFGFYEEYKNDQTIQNLLLKSEQYSKLLFSLN